VAVDGENATQIQVQPHRADWGAAEVVRQPDAQAPHQIRLEPAAGSTLMASDLDGAFGPPETTPTPTGPDKPEQRTYRIDSGEHGHTTALIAELRPGGDSVGSVTLRRDARPS
jgi:hypothetical protein